MSRLLRKAHNLENNCLMKRLSSHLRLRSQKLKYIKTLWLSLNCKCEILIGYYYNKPFLKQLSGIHASFLLFLLIVEYSDGVGYIHGPISKKNFKFAIRRE